MQTLKGFRDFLPEEAIKRQFLVEKIRKVSELMGFDPFETPAIEYAEVLTGKYGNEADKLLYIFEDRGKRKVGLRYDQTVPTCRVVGQYDLPMPFRRYQIQNVWRQEKPQQGRYREFIQVDADIFGVDTPLADGQIIELIYKIYQELGFNKFTIKLNSREILFNIIKESGIDEKFTFPVLQSIDKLDKINKEGVQKELLSKNVEEEKIQKLFTAIENLKEPTGELKQVFEILPKLGIDMDKIKFDPSMVRGLDYYTGTIFEVTINSYMQGSVLGGGRYNNLIKQLTGKDLVGVGFGLGFDRTLLAMDQFNLLPKTKTVSRCLITVFAPEFLDKSLEVATTLRENDINCEVYPDPSSKLEKQLKYADRKQIPNVLIIGSEEIKLNKVILKNMQTKTQELSTIDKVCKLLLA